jgi:hypothetical protein
VTEGSPAAPRTRYPRSNGRQYVPLQPTDKPLSSRATRRYDHRWSSSNKRASNRWSCFTFVMPF